LDTESHERELQDLEFNFIELPKFTKNEAEVTTILDKWLYFIKHADDLEITPAHAINEPALASAYQVANQFSWRKEDLEAYEYRGIKIQDERGALEYANQRGLQQGLQQGEQNKAQEIARNLLQLGLDLAQISQAPGLSIEQINQVTLHN
jgi:predicted transposase/invertase (TIGR01784 family)